MVSLISTCFSEAVIFALYFFICFTLTKPHFSRAIRVWVCAGITLCACAISVALALCGKPMEALTLLPLFAYLPFSIGVFVLSAGDIFEIASACSIAALLVILVKLIKKFVQYQSFSLSGDAYEIIIAVAVTVSAAVAGFIVRRYFREPFRACINANSKSRLLVLAPAVTVSLSMFINFNKTSSFAVLIITLLTVSAFFAVVLLLFVYSARLADADEREKRLSDSLEQQRKNFENIAQSVDEGRLFRHDMRHHLNVLNGMALQNNSVEICEYIKTLNETTGLCASETYCKNPPVNAVLLDYISRAKKIGCRCKCKISLPEELPFDLPDVCIILSNALENAINACEKCLVEMRSLEVCADYPEEGKLKIAVKNSCADDVKLDNEGLPIVKERKDGHGIGLHGVKKIVEKYNGFICCAYENGEFHFCAEIFQTPNNDLKNRVSPEHSAKSSKVHTAVLSSIVCAVIMLNISPPSAAALSEVLSVKIKTISYGWGDNSFTANYPEFSGDNADKLNQAATDFISEARKDFKQHTLRKYEGYVAEDAGYRIFVNNQKYLSARFYATVNLGGSAEYSRCVTLDKTSGKILALADLFADNSDYISQISAEILRQMEYRVENEDASYFIPGGIWSDEECFKEISPEQEFYLNRFGQLVIVFDEYSVAAGKEGSPEFIIPNDIFCIKM